MIGKSISQYRILEKIGEGGMGEVYLAEDTVLERKVALKFLPEKLRQDSTAATRFLREAKSAAAIDHPFICKIHEVGESAGKSFICMEYVKGETLAARLSEGLLPLKSILQIGAEAAEALEAAHGAQVIHRDLKPSNIMLTPEGHPKVMDFGLAKRLRPGAETVDLTTNLTQAGAIVGTLGYMSPEQLQGRALDPLSDIFSLGVILYEMVAGRHPFQENTPMETAKAILAEAPPPLGRYREDVPELLEHTIRKMLAKVPERRYQSIHEVRTNLEGLQEHSSESSTAPADHRTSRRAPLVATLLAVLVLLLVGSGLYLSGFFSGEKPVDSVAILPFASSDEDRDLQHLSEGLARNIINRFSQLSDLKVIGFNSVSRYADPQVDPAVVARDLVVRAVLMTRLDVRDDTIWVSTELIDGLDGRHLWGERYERKLEDLVALQNELAEDISVALNRRLSSQERQQLTREYTDDGAVYGLYLKGQHARFLETPDSLKRAIDYFEQVIAREPGHAPAYAGLATCYFLLGSQGSLPLDEARREARLMASKALQADPMNAEAHLAMGLILGHLDWNWSEAEASLRQALALSPGDANIRREYGLLLLNRGKFEEALAELKAAHRLDPLFESVVAAIAWGYNHKGEVDRAILHCLEWLEVDPSSWWIQLALGRSYLLKGAGEKALERFERVEDLTGPSVYVETNKASAYAQMGRDAEALELLNKLEKTPGSWYYQALVQAARGEKEEAFRLLEQAVDERFPWAGGLHADPFFENLRSDPRFMELVARTGHLK